VIDRLARVLAAAFPDRNAEELAEAVLLAARCVEPGGDSAELLTLPGVDQATPGDAGAEPSTASSDTVATATDLALPAEETDPLGGGGVRVTEVGLRLPTAVSRAPTTATALSLFRRVVRPGPPVVDVDATVEATADAKRLVVVTRPGRERGLDAAIVVDPTPVALAWAQVIDELEGTLRRTGAFRSVSRWTLDHTTRSAAGEPFIRDNAGVVHRADQLVDSAGRRLVLVLSDGTGDAWWRGGTWQVVRRWARVMPTTLLHLLPPSYWGWTVIGQPSGVVRALRPAEPNARMEFRPAWWGDEEVPSGDVPVPVIDLDPDGIVRWARAIVSGSVWTEAVWARHPPDRAPDLASGVALTAADRVSTFEMRASVGAQRLARVLAGAPLLSLPLIQLLHGHVVPDASTSQVAELMVSGLLERLPEKTGERSPLLRFLPGVGDLLYRGTTISQEWDLYDLVTGFLEQNAGSGDMVHALMADPDGVGVVASELVPFAAMGRGMALRLGLDLSASAPAVPSVADTPPGGNSRRYLLLCAIGDYLDTAFAGLPVRKRAATLTRLFESMGYAIVPVSPSNTSRLGVLETLRLFYRDPDRRPDDLVVSYLSSHGHVVGGGEFRLLATDARRDDIAGTGIAMPDLAGLMFQGPTVCRNLVLIDSAFAAVATNELTSAAAQASISWFGAVASTGSREMAFANAFSQAMAETLSEWLAEPAEKSSLTLGQLVHGINGRMSQQQAQSETFAITDSVTSVYFTRPDLSPLKSAYLEVVRRIAPVQLMDRDDELAELAAFCSSPDTSSSYLILTAPPWAGKSALLASFVLDPPPGLRVVAFFGTARFAGQNGRTAFLDVMIEQLAGLLNEQPPALLTETTRETYWLEMLFRAAVSCRASGQRLVLVVDGLDEDGGIATGADSHSIAALVPAQPPAGMRVIVAVRPYPAVPSDVPSHHPLRGSDVRRLWLSSYPRVVQSRIQQDLRRVFDDRPETIEMIGLIVAARGGLSGPDIAELTGMQRPAVENSLEVAGGLLLARKSRLYPDTMMYLLSHEELQNHAAEMLGPQLHDFQMRLEAWVMRYRSLNWPPDTPEYPLIGYFGLLASSGSASQMLELVLDPHRQDRLHILTGNDEALLAEIITLTETPIDPHHQKRVAALLAVIEQRSPSVLAALPRAWAALGDMPRAELLAHAIVNPNGRAKALADLARVHDRAGNLDMATMLYDQALSIHRETGDRHGAGVLLADLARVHDRAGNLDMATMLYEDIQGGRSGSSGPLWREAVRIMTDTGRGYQLLGSGYAIGGRLALTAGDMFAEALLTEGLSDIRIGICRKGEPVTTARIVWADRRRGGVLLESADMTPARSVEFGRVGPRREIQCQFVGFPSQLQRPEWSGHIESVSGHARTKSANGGEVVILEVEPLAWHRTPEWSSWEGMIGSALFCGPHLVGVVSKGKTESTSGSVVAISVAEFFADSEFVRVVETHTNGRPVLDIVEM
jgi:hypothetical protein